MSGGEIMDLLIISVAVIALAFVCYRIGYKHGVEKMAQGVSQLLNKYEEMKENERQA